MSSSRITLLLSAATGSALVLLSGCRDGQERARHELNAASVPFTITDFIQAAHDGRSTLLQEFLAAGMNPDVSNAEGATPLLAAAAQGQGEAVKLLLAQGAAVTRAGPDGTSPLVAAVRSGDERSVNALLAAGADPAIPSPGGESCLTIAAGLGHAVLVEILLPLAKELPDPALRVACVKGHTAAMDVLLTGGADLNLADQELQTPLMLAAAAGQLPAVKMLCYRQARLSVRDDAGRTAADLARTLGKDSTASFLEEWAVRHPDAGPSPFPALAAGDANTDPRTDADAVEDSESNPAHPEIIQDDATGVATVPAVFSLSQAAPALPAQTDPPEIRPLSEARFPDLACDAVNDLPGLLRMTSYKLRPWPVLLKDVDRDHASADVELTQDQRRTVHLRVGSTIPGTDCVVEKLRRRRSFADVNETKLVNASEMVFRQTSTGDVFRATPDKPVLSKESSAFVRIAGSPISWTATPGDAFRLGTTLVEVIRVEGKALTLQNRLTRETVVVPLTPG